MREPGSKEKIRRFLRAHIGEVVTSRQLQDAAGSGVTEWARRVRELREQEGWHIHTIRDDATLRPNEYLLKDAPPDGLAVAFSSGISAKVRAQVLDRNGFTCQMCGLTPGDIDLETGRKVRLHIGHIKDKSLGGKDELSNLRALCSTCNQGAKNITTEKATAIWLLAQIRRSGLDEQRAVYDWLRRKFGE